MERRQWDRLWSRFESASRYNGNSAACPDRRLSAAINTPSSELVTPNLRRVFLRVQPCLVRRRYFAPSRSSCRSLHRESPESALFKPLYFQYRNVESRGDRY